MGKRSSFERREADYYPTLDSRAVLPILRFLPPGTLFSEPCCGLGHLVRHLEAQGLICVHMSDLQLGQDAREYVSPVAVITNPPWSRGLLHELIVWWAMTAPETWLLMDASWAQTRQATPYLSLCTDIVALGRQKWIADSRHTGLDDCAWYRFVARPDGPIRFWPRS